MSDPGRNHARIVLLICSAGLVVAASLVAGFPSTHVSVAQTPYRPTAEPTGTEDGRTMYLRDCAWCHSSDASGTVNGPDITGAGPALVDFMLSTGRMPVSAPDQVAERKDSTTGIGAALTSGRIAPSVRDATTVQVAEAVRTGPGTMPIFRDNVLDEEQLDALVRYVVYLGDPDDEGGGHPFGRLGPVSEGAVAWIIGLGLMIGVIRWIGSRS